MSDDHGERAAGGIDAIQQWIPHRPPFLYVDRIVSADETQLCAEKRVGEDEAFVRGHYPGNPIMPGVLVLECIFQAGALLLSQRIAAAAAARNGDGDGDAGGEPAPPAGVPVLTRIGAAKFRRIVRPGDMLTLTVDIVDRAANAFRLKGSARVADELAATVEFTCALLAEPA